MIKTIENEIDELLIKYEKERMIQFDNEIDLSLVDLSYEDMYFKLKRFNKYFDMFKYPYDRHKLDSDKLFKLLEKYKQLKGTI